MSLCDSLESQWNLIHAQRRVSSIDDCHSFLIKNLERGPFPLSFVHGNLLCKVISNVSRTSLMRGYQIAILLGRQLLGIQINMITHLTHTLTRIKLFL